MPKNVVAIFRGEKIRQVWDEEKEIWYFSIIDIVAVLTESTIPRRYWSDLKMKLKHEGSQVYEKIVQLKMLSSDRKSYQTDAADTQTVLRIIQTIPSPNAEPLKLWLAQVGYERVEETSDPELAIDRALQTYLKKGYTKDWINQRLKSIEVRKLLTDEWDQRGVQKGLEYAILTDEITKAWSELSTKQYKNLKGLKKENLRDNLTNLELVLNMLAETATTEISKKKKPRGLIQNKKIAREGGAIAGNARKEIEGKTGEKIVTQKASAQVYQQLAKKG